MTAFCTDTLTIRHTGEGTGGVHTSVISLLPGRYCITGAGTAGAATTTAKLVDADGNEFDLPDSTSAAAADIFAGYPVVFHTPGCSLVIAEAGADATTALTYTIGRIK